MKNYYSFHLGIPSCIALSLFLLVSIGRNLSTEAWMSNPNRPPTLSLSRRSYDFNNEKLHKTVLFYSSEFDNEMRNSNSTDNPSSLVVERLRVNGVSVSPKGFHILLEPTRRRTGSSIGNDNDNDNDADSKAESRSQDNDDPRTKRSSTSSTTGTDKASDIVLLPLKMTNDPADTHAATSPESLTLCQLLSGVDMAGAILPPDLLGNIVEGHIEDKLDVMYDIDDVDDYDKDSKTHGVFTPVLSPTEGKIWEHRQYRKFLQKEQQKMMGPPSQKIETTMPQITLDQLTLMPSIPSRESTTSSSSEPPLAWQCRLECALPEWKERIVVDVQNDLLASFAYNYDPEASPLFLCIALALRYKAPIVMLEGPPKDNQQQSYSSTATTTHQLLYSRDDLDRDFPQRTTLESLAQQSQRVAQHIARDFEIHKLNGALQIALRLGDTKAAEKIRTKLESYDKNVLSAETKTNKDSLDDFENNILQ